MELNKADKKMMEIICDLYMKGYLLGEINEYLKRHNYLKIFLCKIKRHLKLIPKNISKNHNMSSNNNFVYNLNDEAIKKVESILLFKLKSIKEQYENKKELKDNDFKNLENIESDISELKELLDKGDIEINVSSEDKENSILYKVLQSC